MVQAPQEEHDKPLEDGSLRTATQAREVARASARGHAGRRGDRGRPGRRPPLNLDGTEQGTTRDRTEEVPDRFPDRVFAFDEFGPLGIRPTACSGWAEQGCPDRLPAACHRTHGVRYFHGCYSVGEDILWGVSCRRKGAANTLTGLKSIRAARPGRRPDLRDPGQPVRP
jgi:hypothetical protein